MCCRVPTLDAQSLADAGADAAAIDAELVRLKPLTQTKAMARDISHAVRRWARTPGRARWSWACNPRRYDAGMSPYLLTASLFLFAYLLASVSGSLLLGRLRGVDIRQHCSGNAGGTNAFRTLGWKFALGAALFDIGKGAATAVGGLLVLWPWSIPILLLAWMSDAEPPRLLFCIGVGLYLVFTHRSNLQRLWRGNESRFERARVLHRLYRGQRQ